MFPDCVMYTINLAHNVRGFLVQIFFILQKKMTTLPKLSHEE